MTKIIKVNRNQLRKLLEVSGKDWVDGGGGGGSEKNVDLIADAVLNEMMNTLEDMELVYVLDDDMMIVEETDVTRVSHEAAKVVLSHPQLVDRLQREIHHALLANLGNRGF